jgi:hypothetical protein
LARPPFQQLIKTNATARRELLSSFVMDEPPIDIFFFEFGLAGPPAQAKFLDRSIANTNRAGPRAELTRK